VDLMLFTPVSNIVSGLIRLKSTAYVKDLTVSDVVVRASVLVLPPRSAQARQASVWRTGSGSPSRALER
jgi:hypothetical protein